MKNTIFTGLVLLMFLVYNSCKDPCDDVVCKNGVCVEGSCNCDPGWMGEDCSVMRSSQYKGYWEGIMNCTLITDTIGLIVKEGDNALTELKIQTHNLKYSLGVISIDFDNYVLTGKIDTSFTKFNIVPLPITFTIPNAGEFKVTVSGSGNIKSASEMDLIMKIDPENPIIPDINCQGVMKK